MGGQISSCENNTQVKTPFPFLVPCLHLEETVLAGLLIEGKRLLDLGPKAPCVMPRNHHS